MASSACTQTWPEVTGDAIGEGHKLAWTWVHQDKGCVLRHGQTTLLAKVASTYTGIKSKQSNKRSSIKVYVKWTVPHKSDLHSYLSTVVKQKIRFQSLCEMNSYLCKVSV